MARLELLPAADFHSHLRSGRLMELVAPLVRLGGCSAAYAMPNLSPPVTSVEHCLQYRRRLQQADPQTAFFTSLFLSREITPLVVERARAAGILGIKMYPKGVTTHSEAGVEDCEPYYPVFSAMEEHGLVLNIHGEAPSSDSQDITVLTAEQAFLPVLHRLHRRFPRLKIVLEHCTTKEAVQAVEQCGDSVSGTITAHHLFLTVDDWAGNPYAYCRPVAKLPSDRAALLAAATGGSRKFFLGSDSAPHPHTLKTGTRRAAAGIFTQPYLMSYLAEAFDSVGRLDRLEGFACVFGREFYNVRDVGVDRKIVLTREPLQIASQFESEDTILVPFLAGSVLNWTVTWK